MNYVFLRGARGEGPKQPNRGLRAAERPSQASSEPTAGGGLGAAGSWSRFLGLPPLSGSLLEQQAWAELLAQEPQVWALGPLGSARAFPASAAPSHPHHGPRPCLGLSRCPCLLRAENPALPCPGTRDTGVVRPDLVFTSAGTGPSVPSLALLPVSTRRELLLNVTTGGDQMKLAKPHHERERRQIPN